MKGGKHKYVMKRKIRQLSLRGSLYVTIPKYLIDLLDLKTEQPVEIINDGTKIIIETKVKDEKGE